MPTGETAKPSWTPLLAIAGVLLVALVAGGLLWLAGDSSDDDQRPSPDDLPSGAVAVVSEAPESLGTVTKAEFDHALVQAAASAQIEPTPKPGDKKYGELKETALGELLDAIWIQGQAEAMGITVTSAEISKELEKLKQESFKTEAKYREFLDESHFSKADVDKRVKLQLLSTEIQRRLKDRASGPTEQEEFADFVKRYTARWRSRTVCAPAFAIERCSNGEKPESQQDGDAGGTPGTG